MMVYYIYLEYKKGVKNGGYSKHFEIFGYTGKHP